MISQISILKLETMQECISNDRRSEMKRAVSTKRGNNCSKRSQNHDWSLSSYFNENRSHQISHLCFPTLRSNVIGSIVFSSGGKWESLKHTNWLLIIMLIPWKLSDKRTIPRPNLLSTWSYRCSLKQYLWLEAVKYHLKCPALSFQLARPKTI